MPSIRLVELHPIIVHFPIALLLSSVAFDFLAVVLRRWNLADIGTWLLGFGVVGALLAGLSGAVSSRNAGAASSNIGNLLELHQLFAFGTGLLFACLLAVRLFRLAPRILLGLDRSARLTRTVEMQLRATIPALFANPPSAVQIGLYLFFSVVAASMLGITGYLGGALVYDHGLGMPAALLLR